MPVSMPPPAWATGPKMTCRSITASPGLSRWPITGSAHAWAPRSPTAASSSRERRMARRRLLAVGRRFRGVTQGIQKDLQFTANVYPLGIGRYMMHVRSTDQFFTDADNGTLPAFSIVDPDFDNYSE